MADLLLIDGAMPAGEATQPTVGWQSEAVAPSGSGWNLPLAGAVSLHLLFLAVVLMASRVGKDQGQPPAVYPVCLYNVAEVVAESVSTSAAAPPAPDVAAVKRGSSPPASPQIALASPPVAAAAAVVALTAAPQAIAPLVGLAAAPTLPSPQGDNAGAVTLNGEEASKAGAAAGSTAALSPQMGSGVAGSGLPAAPPALAEVLARPLYRENPPPEYPPLARRRQLEGTVVLEVLVGVQGRADALAVHESSGHALLDEAALKAVKGWRFEPGRRGGAVMAMPVLVPVRFGLR